VVAVMAASILAGCADPVPAPTAPPSSAVRGLEIASTSRLDAEALAEGVGDEASVRSLLEEAGFRVAVERAYAGGRGAIRHVAVVLARFGTVEGAERYLAWLGEHPSDLIGTAEPLDVGDALPLDVYVHLPSACCPKDTTMTLTAWRHGADVVRVLVSGPGADDEAAADLLASLHRWVEAS
jgi:hypothetical protein